MPESAINVLHVSTFDRHGGAAIAAFRLHQGLAGLAVRSRMLVASQSSDAATVIAPRTRLSKLKRDLVALIDRAPLALYRTRPAMPFDVQWTGSFPTSAVARLAPDIIHLHWVAGGFLRIETLAKLARPLVWTLSDMWPFTGGCHVSGDCDRYRSQCGRCWQLGSDSPRDLTHWIWRRKERAWRHIDLSLVAPSRWIADSARSSSLFRERPIRVIPNGVDTSIFKPLEKAFARRCLDMDPDRHVILFGAINAIEDPNKGFDLLTAAIRIVSRRLSAARHELVIFGCSQPGEPPELGLATRYLGRFADEISLALLYNAADLMVVPSRQESFCQTAAEALACGTPVVAFDATGLRDVVEHGVDGYLAQPYEPEDLANGMVQILSAGDGEMARQARQRAVDEFSLGKVARKYAELYEEVLDR
jgi:glycosyltransferase involved in cell wall biosynthesis